MSAAAERIKAFQEGELDRLLEKYRQVMDPRDPEFRKQIAAQVAALDPEDEREVLEWIEAVSIFHDEEWTGQETG